MLLPTVPKVRAPDYGSPWRATFMDYGWHSDDEGSRGNVTQVHWLLGMHHPPTHRDLKHTTILIDSSLRNVGRVRQIPGDKHFKQALTSSLQ